MTPSDAQLVKVLAYGRHVIGASVRLREAVRRPTSFIIVDCCIFSPGCLAIPIVIKYQLMPSSIDTNHKKIQDFIVFSAIVKKTLDFF
jgi:hypothetical protein